jgi:hypothetical protein
MKKIIAMLLLVTGTALAADNAKPKIVFDIPFGPNGAAAAMGTMLVEDLKAKGYGAEMILSGSCAVTLRNLKTINRSTVSIWQSRSHLQQDAHCAMQDPDAKNFLAVMYTSPEYICSINDKLTGSDLFESNSKFLLSIQPPPFSSTKVIDMLQKNSKAEIKTVVYRNSGAQMTGATAKETDFIIGTPGLQLQDNGVVKCYFNTGNKPVENTQPLRTVIKKTPVIEAYVVMYSSTAGMTPAQTDMLRRDMREIMQSQRWKDWMLSRRFDMLSNLSADQQLQFLLKSIADLR